MSEGDEQKSQPEERVRGDSEELRAFAGLADLDEDLSTMHQSNAEVERWRRLSTRGLTPAAGSTREPTGPLDAPIIDLDATTSEMDAHAATTAPGTVAAPLGEARDAEPLEPALPSARPAARADDTPPGGSAEATRKLQPVQAETVRRSFAPPRDGESAPTGSRVVLPRSSVPPPRTSSRPVKVPRPSPPPPDPSEVRGWRPSDPSESDDAIPPVVIPKPAPLPGARRSSQARSEPPSATTTPPPRLETHTRGERLSLDSSVEISGVLLALIGLGFLALLIVLLFLFF
jgi:hypothetical protein